MNLVGACAGKQSWCSRAPHNTFRKIDEDRIHACRIRARGFGGGGHGGDLGAVIDGIPLNEAMSHADGYVDFNVVVPLEIANLAVYKGPVSALYGNFNRSGLVAIETRKEGSYKNVDVSLASHSTLDAQAALGAPLTDGQQLNLAAQVFHTDGFRPQSGFDRQTVSARWSIALTPTMQLAVAGRFFHGEGDSASYLSKTQFDVDPYGIDARVQNDGSKKNFDTLRSDFAWRLAAEYGTTPMPTLDSIIRQAASKLPTWIRILIC